MTGLRRVCPGQVQGLHHFVSASPWPHDRLERVLAEQADLLVGGPDAVLIVDDTAPVKQGRHSVGVQRQYCGRLGKRANCQALPEARRRVARILLSHLAHRPNSGHPATTHLLL